jgi:hypothetical protein
MKQLQYSNSAFELRLEFPSSWDVDNITGVTLRITNYAGTELLAASAATLWTTATTQLASAVSAHANQIVLEDSLGGAVPSLNTGDRIRILMSGAGQWEEVQVAAWDDIGKIATLDADLRWAHSEHAQIIGMFATYDLDLSNTDTWPLNEEVVLRWLPDSDDLEITEIAQVSKFEFAFDGFEEQFKEIYPYEYKAATVPEHRLPALLNVAYRQTKSELATRFLNIDRVVDQSLLYDVLMAKIRHIMLTTGDSRYDTAPQAEQAFSEWQRHFETLAGLPIWSDDDQDEIKDDDEVTTHGYEMVERGL